MNFKDKILNEIVRCRIKNGNLFMIFIFKKFKMLKV